MTAADLRKVKLWDVDIAWEQRDDGSVLVWQEGPLAAYPDRLSDKIAYWAETTPDAIWMAERDASDAWHRVSYRQMFDSIRAIGQVLLDLGLSTDRPLIILSENSIPHALMALAAQYVGIPSAALAPAYSTTQGGYEKLHDIKAQITPGAVFAADLDRYAPAINAVFADLPRLGVSGSGMALPWHDLLATQPSPHVTAANQATGSDTVAKFMFTSGTTGTPKAVIQTQRMLCANMEMVSDCYAFMRDEPPVILDWAPWNHVASGNKVFNMALYHGGTYYIDAGKPAPGLIDITIRNLREVSPTWYFNVPAGFEMLVEAMQDDPALASNFFRDLKLLMYAGAAMAEHTWAALDRLAIAVTGQHVLLSTGLGATETAPSALFCTEPQEKPGNVGVPNKGLILKLVPAEGRWEAHIKGPSITPGYWRNPRLTAEVFDDEGYYNLGDALRFADPEDPSKGFFFDGRTAENFKMATGTWVSVGALRGKLTNALEGLARDAVIVGEGRQELGALLVPFRPAVERIVPGGSALKDTDLFNHPALRARLAAQLVNYNATAGGSSLRVARVMVLTTPLDLDKGEVTDKGSVNQKAVLRHREDLAEALYTGDPRVVLGG
jgi:feruloyl-CoA synthase